MVHALSAVYQRNSTAPDLRNYIGDYLTVQYNALSDLATAGSNIYGGSWIGPAGTQLDADAQSSALTLLISAIPLQNNIDGATASTTGSGSAQPSETQRNDSGSTDPNIAAIVGGSVGGTLLFTCLCIAVWLLLRRHRRQREKRQTMEGDYGHQKYSGRTGSDYTSTPTVPVLQTDRHVSVQSWVRGVHSPRSHRDLDRTRSYVTSHSGTVTSASESTMARELAAEIQALRLQGLRLNERVLEEGAGPPPEYPTSPERTEYYRGEKGRLRLA
ncbi:hypothetical protein AAF712_009144 [Marasmius tenuissimus]|uniref:Epidermal growth factor receptor-like transmembrane-juxtamembrane segment domain-containing protein n=1 Tax=Marasmius tenuissimus TaxID=585030 RepID=A0ABR2ZSX6_9AGAR